MNKFAGLREMWEGVKGFGRRVAGRPHMVDTLESAARGASDPEKREAFEIMADLIKNKKVKAEELVGPEIMAMFKKDTRNARLGLAGGVAATGGATGLGIYALRKKKNNATDYNNA